VLNDLHQLGWQPPAGAVLDWGCGSGVASRACVDQVGTDAVHELWLSDRSNLAVEFAARRAREKYPALSVLVGIPAAVDLLVISHVLTELPPAVVEELIELALSAVAVIWVEPGTYETSLTLIAIRERLRNHFNVVAPCPHQAQCGILAPGNERHWCHQFAPPPDFVFTDASWTVFSHTLEIDLRSLPLSYLVLDRRPISPLPTGAVRILGRPEVQKPCVSMLGCLASGLIAGEIAKRNDPAGYRQLRKGRCPSLQKWQLAGKSVASWEPFPKESAG